MYHTTVANTLFIISTETIFLALFGYIFLKEKINLVTLISIIMGMSGVLAYNWKLHYLFNLVSQFLEILLHLQCLFHLPY